MAQGPRSISSDLVCVGGALITAFLSGIAVTVSHGAMADCGESSSSPGRSGRRRHKLGPTTNCCCTSSEGQRADGHPGQSSTYWTSTHYGAVELPVMQQTQLDESQGMQRLWTSQRQAEAGRRQQGSHCEGSACADLATGQAGPLGQEHCEDRSGRNCSPRSRRYVPSHPCVDHHRQRVSGGNFRSRRYVCGADHWSATRGIDEGGASNQQSPSVESTRGMYRTSGEAQAGPARCYWITSSTWQTTRQSAACGKEGERTLRQLGNTNREPGKAAGRLAARAGGGTVQRREGQGRCGCCQKMVAEEDESDAAPAPAFPPGSVQQLAVNISAELARFPA